MSIGSSWQNFSNSTPPERGSFPLDYKGICNEFVKDYIACLRKNNKDANVCKHLSKKYLSCRMDNGLMDKESFSSLGFQEEKSPPKTTLPNEKNSLNKFIHSKQQQPYGGRKIALELPQTESVFSTKEFIRAFKAQPPMTRFYIALGFLMFSLAGIQATAYIEEKMPVPKHEIKEEVIDLDEETRKQLEKEVN